MKVDIAGKVRNTVLPRSKPLLPVFEAVVNSLQALEELPSVTEVPHIDILAVREPALPEVEGTGAIHTFVVTDNGVGFNARNIDSFFTSDTRYKAGKGGKGLGRFLWLKAFRAAEIESHYLEDGKMWQQKFTFTSDADQPPSPAPSSALEPTTILRLVGMLDPYKETCPRSLAVISRRLIEHCLPFFIDSKAPSVTLRDEIESIDLNKAFAEAFAAGATDHTFQVKDHTFRMRGLRLYSPYENLHRLMYAANSREVRTEKIDKVIPNLQSKLSDPTGPFVYLGFIEGDYLDKTANGERTDFSIPSGDDDDNVVGEITIRDIRADAVESVRRDLAPFLEEINREKEERITTYIAQEAPEYRPLVRYLPQFIDKIAPTTKGLALEIALHEQLHQRQRELKQESGKLLSESGKESLKPEEYEAKVAGFIERANEIGKSSLAQYVAHRRVILEFLEKSLQVNPETGKYPLEEIIHRIIYPMRAASDDVPYEQQNLWIIDERLAYHGYLASDLPLHTATVLGNESQSRPDIMLFDRALTFAEDEAVLNSLVIVEFKKPDRSNYRNEDPIEQVYRLIREIKGGHFKDRRGLEIKVQSERIPAYAYIICDTKREVEIIAEDKGLIRTPDNLGYFGYNPSLSAYVEVISYTKLLRDAKKRNKILFDKLNLPMTSFSGQ
jgi:hypothetical protein